jgi:putative Mg2+ transporter-C (MgtC) family protein
MRMLIGIGHDLHGRPKGTTTLGLVSLGACIATPCAQGLSMTLADDAGVSRAVQGMVTDVGFLGAA